jgi:N-acylneuraminate cytidylyltransferase
MDLAVIPARGGSKRIPRKNLKPFCGKPMLAWSIETAIESGCFSHVVVSTDDEEIAETAKRYGAVVPFTRPAAMADDHASTLPVFAHALQFMLDAGHDVRFMCGIHATAPFVRPADLRAGRELIEQYGCDYAFPVASFPFPIQRAVRLDENRRKSKFQPEHYFTRSQDLEEAYHDAGLFYWGRREAWLAQRKLFEPSSVAIQMPRDRVQDIDTREDWDFAEKLFHLLQAS